MGLSDSNSSVPVRTLSGLAAPMNSEINRYQILEFTATHKYLNLGISLLVYTMGCHFGS